MGLFSWIRNKYYNYKLCQADRLAQNTDYDGAKSIYEALLDKQPMASIHLAKMLVANASVPAIKIDVLKQLLELQKCSTEVAKNEFVSILSTHISDMEATASSCFLSKRYNEAVGLLEAIKNFRTGQNFTDTLYSYKAYQSFTLTNTESWPSLDYREVVYYLQQKSTPPTEEITSFIGILEQQKRFQRGIMLLLPFLNIGNWVKESIFNYIVEIVSNNDSERKNVKHFNDFCLDEEICKESAVDLAKRAHEKATKKEYSTAVLFDAFAAEYLWDNNSFNVDRCHHIVEDVATRANAKEIEKLLVLARSLNLSESQISKIYNDINGIAVAADPATAIAICRLFIGDTTFDKLYVEKALSLVKGCSELNLEELRGVIRNITTEVSLPDVLAPFIRYVPALESEFVEAAIKVIVSQKSIELLDKYWEVKDDPRFLEAVINTLFSNWKIFAKHIAQSHRIFLDEKKNLEFFCNSLRDTNDLDFILNILERLLKDKKPVDEFYISIILKHSNVLPSVEESLDLVNRGLENSPKDTLERLLTEKKHLITQLISDKKFDHAEIEIISILNVDKEAPTLLAELYFNQAKNANDIAARITFYDKVISLSEQYCLYDRFLDSLQESLGALVELAKKTWSEGKSEKGFQIAERIKVYWAYWIPLFAWLRNATRSKSESLVAAIKYDAATLQEIVKECPSAKDYASEETTNLWSRYFDNVIAKSESQPKDKAITSLSKLRTSIATYAPKEFSDANQDKLARLVVRLKWQVAIEDEHEQLLSDAITLYDEIAADVVTSYVNRAELRSLICHVKSNAIDPPTEHRINQALQLNSYQALREDLAYRYACYLLMQVRPADAEYILRTYLPDETDLLGICDNIYVKEAERKLAEFNHLVKRLNTGEMSVAEAIEFKTAVHKYKKQITPKLKDLGRAFSQFTPKIEAYILNKMFEEEVYMELLAKLMQENPNYIEDNTDFHNVAIASLGVVESDLDDEPIVRRAIATVLTAIFSDRLFVQSLDYTSWDDKYTFTLDESLGQTDSDDYDALPDNVNFANSVENENIAIRDVQNSLLARLEASVRKYHPSLEKFYNEERNALSKLIELRLDKSYILASPQLCRTLASLRMSIENAFAYELDQNYGNKEDVIALGCVYGFTGGEYSKYQKGYNALVACKSALTHHPGVTVEEAFTTSQIDAIKRFKRLFSDLKSAVGTAMNEDVRSELNFKAFLGKFEIICKSIKDTSLSLTCANYVNGKVVHLLNNDTMPLHEGVAYMVRVHNIAPSNEQVKNNLEGILNNLVHKAEKDNSAADRNALQKALQDLNGKFDDAIALSVIIAKLSSKRIRPYTALSQLYDLYSKKKNDAEVCDALVALIKLCIHKYIINEEGIGTSNVKSVLNQLQTNRSIVFKERAKLLAAEYIEIFEQLPSEAKLLMMGGRSLGLQTLNSKGLALKDGLDYLRNLSDLDQLLKRN